MPRLKPFEELSQRQQTRYGGFGRRLGLTSREVYEDAGLRAAAEGHKTTPRSPNQALRHPTVYQAYLSKHRDDLRFRVMVFPTAAAEYKKGLEEAEKSGDMSLTLLFSKLQPDKSKVPEGYTSRGPFVDLADAENYLSGSGMPGSLFDHIELTKSTGGTWLAWVPKDTK